MKREATGACIKQLPWLVLIVLSVGEPLWTIAGGPTGWYARSLALLSGVLIACGVRRWLWRERTRVVLVLLTLGAYVAVSLWWTPTPAYGLEKALFFFGRTLAPALALAAAPPMPLTCVARGVALPGLVVAAILSTAWTPDARTAFPGVNGIWVFRAVALTALTTYVMVRGRGFGRAERTLAGLIVIAAGLMVIQGAYLGPMVAMVGSATLLFVRRLFRRGSRSLLTVGTPLLAAVVAIAFVYALTAYDRLDTVVEDRNILARMQFISVLTSAPISSWTLIGHGLGSSASVLEGMDTRAYPHNVLIELYYELGLLGIAVFGVLVITTMRETRTAVPASTERDFTVAYVAFSFIGAMVSGDMAHNADLWIALVMGSVLIGRVYREPDAVMSASTGRPTEEKTFAGAP